MPFGVWCSQRLSFGHTWRIAARRSKASVVV